MKYEEGNLRRWKLCGRLAIEIAGRITLHHYRERHIIISR
jgi:hypothetical protein